MQLRPSYPDSETWVVCGSGGVVDTGSTNIHMHEGPSRGNDGRVSSVVSSPLRGRRAEVIRGRVEEERLLRRGKLDRNSMRSDGDEDNVL